MSNQRNDFYMEYELINPPVNEIKGILNASRQNVIKAMNNELLAAYWKTGKIIVQLISKAEKVINWWHEKNDDK